MARRVFLLSPASCTGERARVLIRKEAAFPLAGRVRTPEGAPIGEVFSFLSGLYFRGKLAYAQAFAGAAGALVITPDRGLVEPEEAVTIRDIRRFASVPVDAGERRYRGPFERDARRLAAVLGPDDDVVLLGSIATAKYIGVLSPILGARLRFPADFAGRGDMSRGGLLLRCVRERRELAYVGLDGGARHGRRPPKLAPFPRTAGEGEA
ncbi:MAG TPA: hypothetical protein VG777_06140 [Thermoanaerobaculia bacterium]|nr:hypothetical protein [Thermoanaerobaculia bacterium]